MLVVETDIFEIGTKIKDMFEKNQTIISDGNVDYTLLLDTRVYKSVEEMLMAENIDIMYLKKLPVGYKEDRVSIADADGEMEILAVYSNEIDKISLRITTSKINFSEYEKLEDIESLSYNSDKIYLNFYETNNLYSAIWRNNQYDYELQAISHEILIEALNSIYEK